MERVQKYKSWPASLAFLFLALLLVSLATRFWAAEKGFRLTGPTHIAAGEGQVWVFTSGDLYKLSPDGDSLGVFGASITGLNTDPIDLAVMTDGRLLLAEQDPARIRLCGTDAWHCDTILDGTVAAIKRQFKILSGNMPGEWLLTDAVGDTLWEVREPDNALAGMVPEGTLAGPNGLVFDRSGNLWVADTDHRRIIELLPAAEGGYVPGREHSAVNDLTEGKRYYPMMLVLGPRGKLWVTQAADFSKTLSDLVVYDPEQGVEALVVLPEGAFTTDIAVNGDQVLVTDLEQFVIYQVDSKSMKAGGFGDSVFRQNMAQIQESRSAYDRLGAWSLASLSISAVLMILFAIQATPKEKRWTAPPDVFDPEKTSGEIPQTRRVHWLERNPRTEMVFKWAERVFYTALVLLVVSILIFYAWLQSEAAQAMLPGKLTKLNELGIALLLAGLLAALLVQVVRLSKRAMNRKLGTDGKRVYIHLEDGRELAVDPSQLAYTHRMILYRKYTIPLQGGARQALYLPGELDTWLAPLLRQARKISEFQAMKHQWEHRDEMLIWTVIATTAAAVLLLTIYMMDA